MIYQANSLTCMFLILCVIHTNSQTAPKTDGKYDAMLEIAKSLLPLATQDTNDKSGGNAIDLNQMIGMAQVIGGLMKKDDSESKNDGTDSLDAVQILAGISQLISTNKPKVNEPTQNNEIGIDAISNIASMLMSDSNKSGLINLLPMAIQVINSLKNLDGDNSQANQDYLQSILQPFLEQLQVLWHEFSNSPLADLLWQNAGINQIFKGFYDRNGELDYDKFLIALNNQSFRRRWLKSAIIYISDWINHIAEPEAFKKYSESAQKMLNAFLTVQQFPSDTLFDPKRPSESIANLLNFITRKYVGKKVSSITYVKPIVTFVKGFMDLANARVLLQKLNANEISDKLTDAINLEVIEPVLKVHRAYRFATESPQCDKYVLCEVNSHDPEQTLGLAGFKAGITRFGSTVAALFMANQSRKPFSTFFNVLLEPNNCEAYYREECSAFHEGEAKVKMEYIHNEL